MGLFAIFMFVAGLAAYYGIYGKKRKLRTLSTIILLIAFHAALFSVGATMG